MPQVAINAEVYAAARLNIFFTAHNQTPADGNLTGQCVTLNKWFLAEMTDVPNPFNARGDARYVGQTLVRQGHAVQIPYEQRRRGDFAVFEYGLYGHIGVLLDDDRIFEQNVNVGGVARKLITEGGESWYVYASRIGRLSESWRAVRATIYRINSYKEGATVPTFTAKAIDPDVVRQHYSNFTNGRVQLKASDPACQNRFELNDENWGGEFWKGLNFQQLGFLQAADAQIVNLQTANTELSKRPTQDQLDTQVKINDLQKAEIDRLNKEVESLKAQVGDNSKWETFKALVRELFNVTK